MAVAGWFNQNKNRAYPFLADTVDQPMAGPLTLRNLSDDIIVDAGFSLGADARFDAAIHTIALQQIRREGSLFLFDFISDAPGLFGARLTFIRHAADPDYVTEFSDSGATGLSDSSLSGSTFCSEPLWGGFLVTGRMESLTLLLAVDGTLPGDAGAVLEPTLIHNRTDSYVTSFNTANDDRTRVTAPDDCDPIVLPEQSGATHVSAVCLTGEIRFVAGYNCHVRQSDQNNSLVFSAVPGDGAGQPCVEVPTYLGEEIAANGKLLSGGPRCNEVLRSINGVGGKQFNLQGGLGVTVTSLPSVFTVIVDVDMAGLGLCMSADSLSCP